MACSCSQIYQSDFPLIEEEEMRGWRQVNSVMLIDVSLIGNKKLGERVSQPSSTNNKNHFSHGDDSNCLLLSLYFSKE